MTDISKGVPITNRRSNLQRLSIPTAQNRSIACRHIRFARRCIQNGLRGAIHQSRSPATGSSGR